ncbi:hypothetical protein D3C75_813490 [compost metagenome]
MHGLLHHQRRVVVHRAGQAPRHQVPAGGIGAVGECFEPQRHANFITQGLGGAVVGGSHQHQRQAAAIGRHSLQYGTQLERVGHHVVVQRTMGLHISHATTQHFADAVQRTDLVVQQVTDFFRAAGHGTAAEADQVRVGRVRADGHAVLQRQGHGAAHDAGVPGVVAAGDVGAIDVGHDFGIQAHAPAAETLAHVAIE